jgi:hypothetical protein
MTKLAQNLDQFKKHRGDFMTGFGASVSPALNTKGKEHLRGNARRS